MKYHWIKAEAPCLWALAPENINDDVQKELRLASIRPYAEGYKINGVKTYYATYWFEGQGHRQGDWSIAPTVHAAKIWIENQLNRFWEPPVIINRVLP